MFHGRSYNELLYFVTNFLLNGYFVGSCKVYATLTNDGKRVNLKDLVVDICYPDVEHKNCAMKSYQETLITESVYATSFPLQMCIFTSTPTKIVITGVHCLNKTWL